MTSPRALIAEDEPLLAASLQAELRLAWPELEVVANVGSGTAAIERTLALRPDVLFLDIRMPGASGLEVARAIAEDGPDDSALPLVVFVTAYDQYAVEAFQRAAFDYLLKPVDPARLARTCARLKAAWTEREAATRRAGSGDAGTAGEQAGTPIAAAADTTLERLRQLLAATTLGAASPATPRLAVIQAAVGAAIHLVPVGEVIYFEAADKYVRVVTAEREYLIRTSLRELLPQLDPERFWQIHRGTVVRHDAIATAVREESGKVTLALRGCADRLIASRLHAHLFKPM